MYKNNSKNKHTNNPVNKWASKLNIFQNKDNEYLKNCPMSLAMKEVQIKLSLRFHLTPVRMAII
jgi:hypothetical protein